MMAIKPLSDPVITTETNDKEIKRKYARQAAEEAQHEELRGAFEMFDMNADGYIDRYELHKTLKEMGQDRTDEDVRAIIRSVDLDGNGKIDFEEFKLYMKPKINNRMSEVQLQQAFELFDEDNRGYIDKSNLKSGMEKMGEKLTNKELDEMMESVDITGNGRISFAEFRIMMLR